MRCALVALLLASVSLIAGCPISPNDALPSLGDACVIAEGHCGLEHVCRPSGAGAASGVCMPVTSYGAPCDALEPVTHPPGKKGEDDVDTVELTIDAPEDMPLLDNVRSFVGQVRMQRQGLPIQLGNLCGFRDVQRVGDGLGLGKSDVTDLNGLQSLTSVEGGLAIYSNPALASLAGLENLVDITSRTVEGVAFDVVIVGNFTLDDVVVEQFQAALEARVGRPLAVVACGNQGEPCGAQEQALAQALTSSGLSR